MCVDIYMGAYEDRNVRGCAHGHTATKWQGQDLNLV